jgi:hypothetical protein
LGFAAGVGDGDAVGVAVGKVGRAGISFDLKRGKSSDEKKLESDLRECLSRLRQFVKRKTSTF